MLSLEPLRPTDTRDRDRHNDSLPESLYRRAVRDRNVPRLLCGLLPLLPLRALQPLQESLSGGNDPLPLRILVELFPVPYNLALDPCNVRLRLRVLHLRLGDFRLAQRALRGEQHLGHLAPVAVHHVRLIEFDLEEERRARRVRRCAWPGVVLALASRWRLRDRRAHDEALERLALPLSGLGYFLSESLDFRDRVEDRRGGHDEPPLFGERIDDRWRHCFE